MASEHSIVYLNGRFLPLSQAHVSVMDRGFLFGDGIYEVIPAYAGHLFRLQEHLQRLDQSLREIRLASPHSHDEWRTIIEQLLTGEGDEYVYLQITRGAAPKRDHAFPEPCSPTVFIMVSPILPFAGAETGVRAVTLADSRWQRCHIKAITLLPNILLRQEAVDQGAAEAILIRDGNVTEGAASNVFIVLEGVLRTPPKGAEILPGITRDLILELAVASRIQFRESAISFGDLKAAEEIWLSSSTREILPVTELDSKAVGDGRPGPLWRTINDRLQAFKQTLRTS